MQRVFAAIDLGGSKIYTVLAGPGGNILAAEHAQTRAGAGPGAVINQLAGTVHNVLSKAGLGISQLAAAGVCAPGFFDWQRRIFLSLPNLEGWKDVPLEEELSSMLGVPVVAENDANAAALGEMWKGAGRGYSEAVYITVSTGIGAGIIAGNSIYRGCRGMAGEIGHMIVNPNGGLCGCGRQGCLEAQSSGTAIAKMAAEAIKAGRSDILAELAGGNAPTAREVVAAAARGDRAAVEIFRRSAYYLGLALINVANMLNPQIIIIGGGIAESGELLLGPLREAAAMAVSPPVIKKAELGVGAGVTGMLALLQDELK